MAGSAGSIFVDLLLRDAAFVLGLRRGRQETSNFAKGASSDLAATRKAFLDVINPVNNLSSAVRNLGVSVASYLSVQKIFQFSDSYKQLESRLSIVVEESGQLRDVQEELYQIALRTRQPLEGIYNLYTRLSQAIPEAERGQYDLISIVESVNQALAITGEGSAQASSAILQFTQAAASGFQASGAEINALLDSAPRLAQALQRSFGDGSKSLKQLAQDGELTTETVLKALEKTSGEAQKLGEEFSKSQMTVSQALTNLETSFTKFVGTEPLIKSFTANLANNINVVAQYVDLLSGNLRDATHELEKFLGTSKGATQFSQRQIQEAIDAARGPQATNYTPGDIQAAIYMAERLRQPKQKTDKEKEKEAKEAQKDALKTANELSAIYERNRGLIMSLDSATIDYIDTQGELQKLFEAGKIDVTEYYTALSNLDAKFDESAKKTDKFGVDIEEFGKRAASNIQDAFAEFLFDPFDSGLKGMAKGFVDTIRKMIAEAQAAKLAKALFGEAAGGEGSGWLGQIFGSGTSSTGGNFFSKIFDGLFADGGYIQPGHFGIAGEAGAELVYGGKTGATVIPQSNNNGGNIYQIDARGADEGAVIRLEKSLLALAGPGVIEQRVSSAQTRGIV